MANNRNEQPSKNAMSLKRDKEFEFINFFLYFIILRRFY